MDNMKIVLGEGFAGKDLCVGAPADFDRVRTTLRAEKRRHRSFGDVASIAAYLEKWGDKTVTTVYTSLSGINFNLDETDALQTGDFIPSYSLAYQEWSQFFGHRVGQVKLKEFVERRVPDIIDGVRLLNAVENLDMTVTIEHKSKFDDDNNYSITYKEGTEGKPETVKLPKQIVVRIPLYEGDKETYRFLIDVKMRTPKAPGDAFTFELLCHDLPTILREAMADKIDEFKGLLTEGWEIYGGT